MPEQYLNAVNLLKSPAQAAQYVDQTKKYQGRDNSGIDVPDWVQEAKDNASTEMAYRTPSQSPFPVFVLCQPMYVDTKVANNAWMKGLKGKDAKLDKEKFMGEWFNFYKLLAADSLVYLLVPLKGLQDQTYVNSFVYLPHIHEKDVCILSNFTAEGRAGEEIVAQDLLKKLGYQTIKSPYKFEGYPELKYLRDDIYFGGYGIRTQIEAHQWLTKNFGCKIIPIKETDEKLYHLDCLLFVIDEENIIACTELIDKATMHQIERVCNVHAVTKEDCYENACNSVRVGDLILTASSLEFMRKRDPEYVKEWKKNQTMEKICRDVGLEIMYLEMSEAGKSGAALSCFCTPLNKRF
jgi:N-dimethylarginine dimethylaminohydrolase